MRLLILPILIFLFASPLQARKISQIDEVDYKRIYTVLDKNKYQKSGDFVGSFQEIYVDYPQDDHNHKSLIKKIYIDDDGKFYKLKNNTKVEKSKKQFSNKRITSTGDKRVLIVALADPEVSADSFIYNPDTVEEMYFSRSQTSLHNYYKEVSNNAVSFSGEIAGLLLVSGLCEGGDIFKNGGAEFVLNEVDKAFDLSKYDSLSFLLPDDDFCLGGALGIGSLGNIQGQSISGSQVSFSYNFNVSAGARQGNTDYYIKVVGHEFGHNFGLKHDNGNACGEDIFEGDCESLEYGGMHSLMGFSPNLAHINAIHQEDLGWLKQNQIAVIDDESFQGEFTISGLSRNNTTDLKAIKIKRDDGSYYVVEYREPVGMDNIYYANAPLTYLGLQIYLNNDSFLNNSLLLRKDFASFNYKDSSNARDFLSLASFKLAEPFYDPVSDIRVTLTRLNSSSATLLVEKNLEEVVINDGGGITNEPEEEVQRVELSQSTFVALNKISKAKLNFQINESLPVNSNMRIKYPSVYKKLLKFKKRSKKINSSSIRFPIKIAKKKKFEKAGFESGLEIPLTIEIFDTVSKTVSESIDLVLSLN